ILLEVVMLGGAGMAITVIMRSAVRIGMRRALGPERVLFLGSDDILAPLVAKMRSHPEYGLDPIGHLALIESEPPSREFGPPVLPRSSRMLKRSINLAVAVPAFVLATPIMVLIALALKLDSPGPVLFRQERIGKRGRRFEVLKFRTMGNDAESRVQDLFEQS